MAYTANQLPKRFPVGTKFVIEGKRAAEGEVQVFNRFIEFPDGTKLRLPKKPEKSAPAGRRTRIKRSRGH